MEVSGKESEQSMRGREGSTIGESRRELCGEEKEKQVFHTGQRIN
jgi:hypothetical protein